MSHKLALAAALALASLALIDHAATREGGPGLAHRLIDAAHLLLAGGWLGGLPLFALCLVAARREPLRREAIAAMRRFSDVGCFGVAALIATGALNVAFVSGRAPWPPSTPYRALLDVKIALAAAMAAIALFNRYRLAPRLKASRRAGAALLALTLVNLAAAALIVALVSYFGLLDPA